MLLLSTTVFLSTWTMGCFKHWPLTGPAIFRILLWLLWDQSRICQSIGGFGQKHVLMMNLLEGYSLGTHRIIEAAALWYCYCNSRSFQEITNSSIRHFSYILDIIFCFVPVLHFVDAECANSFLGRGALNRWVHCTHDYIYLWIMFEKSVLKSYTGRKGWQGTYSSPQEMHGVQILLFPLNISTLFLFCAILVYIFLELSESISITYLT